MAARLKQCVVRRRDGPEQHGVAASCLRELRDKGERGPAGTLCGTRCGTRLMCRTVRRQVLVSNLSHWELPILCAGGNKQAVLCHFYRSVKYFFLFYSLWCSGY